MLQQSVIPAIKFPIKSECRNIAISACQRAVNIGLPSFILEQEHIAQQTANPDWAGECTQAQVEVLEKFQDEYGIKTALKATPADIRDEAKGENYRTSSQYHLKWLIIIIKSI